MTDIDSIIDGVLAREGGFVNDPDDHGGATNRGITQEVLGQWLGRPATIDDVRNLTEETARAIYTSRYYTQPHFDRLPDGIQAVVVDAGVNSGPGQSAMFLQQVLNDAGYGPLKVDGGVGPKTIAAAQAAWAAMGTALVRALVEKRRAFLQRLAANDPSQKKFEKGWMARCDQLESAYA